MVLLIFTISLFPTVNNIKLGDDNDVASVATQVNILILYWWPSWTEKPAGEYCPVVLLVWWTSLSAQSEWTCLLAGRQSELVGKVLTVTVVTWWGVTFYQPTDPQTVSQLSCSESQAGTSPRKFYIQSGSVESDSVPSRAVSAKMVFIRVILLTTTAALASGLPTHLHGNNME